ncbi:MAG TPA: ROK family protein [Vicinamibacteria bacterium]|nr:ROK family protein [Vicinamibacteria bacterium]
MRTLGADLGDTKLLLVAQSPDGRVVARVPTGPAFDGPALEEALLRFLGQLGGEVEAVGLAVPGLVGPGPRVEACDVLPGLVGWRPPPSLARGRLAVINDAEAALREECHDAPSDLTAAVVMAGTGIGAALLVDGRRLAGARGWAGELGGIPIAGPGGVRKLDELASGAALVARLGVDGARVRERVERSDAEALRAVAEAGAALGLGLATVIDIVNPARVAVGGGLTELPGYLEAALASAEAHALPELWGACRVGRVRAGELVAALGAARAAAEASG